jgi:hypothetical protein
MFNNPVCCIRSWNFDDTTKNIIYSHISDTQNISHRFIFEPQSNYIQADIFFPKRHMLQRTNTVQQQQSVWWGKSGKFMRPQPRRRGSHGTLYANEPKTVQNHRKLYMWWTRKLYILPFLQIPIFSWTYSSTGALAQSYMHSPCIPTAMGHWFQSHFFIKNFLHKWLCIKDNPICCKTIEAQ